MRKSERERLRMVSVDVALAREALMRTPADRGVALGKILDSIEVIESLLAPKKDTNEY